MRRTARAIWREQEFLQIAHDVLARAAELHVLLAFGDILPDGLLFIERRAQLVEPGDFEIAADAHVAAVRSEEHTSELQSLMRTSYAVFSLKKKKTIRYITLHLSYI